MTPDKEMTPQEKEVASMTPEERHTLLVFLRSLRYANRNLSKLILLLEESK